MKAMRTFASVIFFILAFMFLMIFIISLSGSVIEGRWIAFTLMLVFLLGGILVKGTSKVAKEKKEHKKALGVIAISKLYHVEGLQLAENTSCEVSVTPEQIIVEGGGTTFNLNITQIRAAEVKTDVEIANIVHSSAVKGIAGGLLFGPIGLVVGARAKSKTKKSYSYYLIINYTNSAGELAAMLFTSESSPLPSTRIANKIKPAISNNPKLSVQL